MKEDGDEIEVERDGDWGGLSRLILYVFRVGGEGGSF